MVGVGGRESPSAAQSEVASSKSSRGARLEATPRSTNVTSGQLYKPLGFQLTHSLLSATSGSTRAARRAGNAQAARMTMARRSGTTM
jgi:hypothetical protein